MKSNKWFKGKEKHKKLFANLALSIGNGVKKDTDKLTLENSTSDSLGISQRYEGFISGLPVTVLVIGLLKFTVEDEFFVSIITYRPDYEVSPREVGVGYSLSNINVDGIVKYITSQAS